MYASQQFVIIGKRCLESDKTAFLIAQNGRAIGWKDASELPDEKIEACVLAFSPPFFAIFAAVYCLQHGCSYVLSKRTPAVVHRCS